jgi:flavin-binding protein dodecin
VAAKVYKKIEVVGMSSTGTEDAIQNAVAKSSTRQSAT